MFTVPPIVGTIIMLTVSREKKGVLLFGYYLVSPNRTPTVAMGLKNRLADIHAAIGINVRYNYSPGLRMVSTEHGW